MFLCLYSEVLSMNDLGLALLCLAGAFVMGWVMVIQFREGYVRIKFGSRFRRVDREEEPVIYWIGFSCDLFLLLAALGLAVGKILQMLFGT